MGLLRSNSRTELSALPDAKIWFMLAAGLNAKALTLALCLPWTVAKGNCEEEAAPPSRLAAIMDAGSQMDNEPSVMPPAKMPAGCWPWAENLAHANVSNFKEVLALPRSTMFSFSLEKSSSYISNKPPTSSNPPPAPSLDAAAMRDLFSCEGHHAMVTPRSATRLIKDIWERGKGATNVVSGW